MSQGPLCPNLSQKVQKEVSQMANHNLSPVILLGGLSVNLNHLKTSDFMKIHKILKKHPGRYRIQVKKLVFFSNFSKISKFPVISSFSLEKH